MSVAVIYTRVSTAEQAEKKQSLDSQEKACRDFAARKDLEIDRVFIEAGESAKTADRTQLLEMIKYCQETKGKVKYVIVWKVDRFARRAEDHLMLKALFAKLGIQLLSATEAIENTNTGKLMETILAGFAEFDNGMRAERSRGGMQARVEQGCWVHQAPVGYKNVKDSEKRPTLAPDEMAPRVQRLLREFGKGIYNQKQAVKLAREFGIATKKGKPISANGVYKLLRNPIYKGIIVSTMVSVEVIGLHPPLISSEEFDAISGILSGRRKATAPTSRGKPKWPLRQFIKCGNCEHPLTGSTSRGRSATYDYYHCTKCNGNVRVLRDVAHAEFESLLSRVKPSDGLLRLFKAVVLKRWHEEYKEIQDKRRQVDLQIQQCEDDRRIVIEKSIKGVFDDETVKDQLATIEIRKADLGLVRAELSEGESEKEIIVDYAINFMANSAVLWRDAELENRQRFQKMVFPSGITYIFGEGFGTAPLGACFEELSLIQHEIDELAESKKTLVSEESLLVIPRGIEPRLPG